jgi:sigma-B regulation protein RsbQ
MGGDVLKRNNVNVKGNLESLDTIVFAHGFGSDQTAWRKVSAAFEKDYRLVLFDHVGAGDADQDTYSPAKYASLQAYALDLIEICSSLNLQHTIFVGHSVGAMIGLLASISVPGLFSRLALIGTSPRYLNDEDYIGGFTQEGLDGLYAAMRADYLEWASGFSQAVMLNNHQPELATEFEKSLRALRPDLAIQIARSIFQSDYRNILHQVQNEVLLIHSRNDIAVPETVASYLHQHIPGSKLVNIEAEGHFPHIINLIQQFIVLELA